MILYFLFQSENVTGSVSMLFMAIFLSMGMAYMAASFISFLVQERQSKVSTLDISARYTMLERAFSWALKI